MKKWIAAILVCMLCLGCVSALAEIDLAGVQVMPLEEKKIDALGVEFTPDLLLVKSEDQVEVTNDYVSVISKGVKIYFDLANADGIYLCLTQDLFASLETYNLFDDAAYDLHENLVTQGVNLWIYDVLASRENFVYFYRDADLVSQVVGTLNDLSLDDQLYILNILGAEADQLVAGKDTAWIDCGNFYLTIAGSQYVAVQVGDSAPEDVAALLGALSVTPAN